MAFRYRRSASSPPRACLEAAVRAPPAPPLPVRLRSGSDARDSSPRSPAYSSRSHIPDMPNPLPPPPRFWSCPTARSDSARQHPHGPTLSSVVHADDAIPPPPHFPASPLTPPSTPPAPLSPPPATTYP